MFRTLFTPLSARFNIPSPYSPKPVVEEVPSESDELDPEDFARDVLVELMRNGVERLKAAEDLPSRIESVSEIQRIMQEDVCTKDVFREMDGFLVLMSVLSTLQPQPTSEDSLVEDLIRATRSVFVLLGEALHKHPENAEYFKTSLGYHSFHEATLSLVSSPRTVKHTFGFLTSLALHDVAWCDFFLITHATTYDLVDKKFTSFSSRLGVIRRTEPLRVLYDALPGLTEDGPMLRYCGYKLLERLALHKHRNQCLLNGLGLVESLFERLCAATVAELPKPERQVIQKLLRRILDLGASTNEARKMFRQAVHQDDTLDPDALEVLRAAMKVRWPEHFSLESPGSLQLNKSSTRAPPPAGFTFMIWIWIEKVPKDKTHTLFAIRAADKNIIALKLRPDGQLDWESAGTPEDVTLKTNLAKGRWTHVVLVHHPQKGPKPTLRVFVDGTLADSANRTYPKGDAGAEERPFVIGDSSKDACLNWCMASAYFLATPLSDELPRFIHHLGPRYVSRFQASDLVRFMTYEAATALNIHLFARAEELGSGSELAGLVKMFKNGIGINESHILLAVTPPTTQFDERGEDGEKKDAALIGDVVPARCNGLDLDMWEIGGAAVSLRLVQLAKNPHELSRALGVLTDGLRNSWQNSEDMERLRGYDILASILRTKSQLINITGFETLFEFLGLNFRSPDHSTVVNVVAYRAIALDFQLWSKTRDEIQIVHLEHFATLLETSRHKEFNIKQRMIKMGIVRKLLFVLQTDWYPSDMMPILLQVLQVTAAANFSTDDAIRPIVSYLAANLHEASSNGASSPRSTISRIDYQNAQTKAEHVFAVLVSLLETSSLFTKFTSALPLTRICLLLLGDHPTPNTATLVLRMIALALNVSTSFSRKFELVSGWSVLKVILPYSWDVGVQEAVFDVLFGLQRDKMDVPGVICPHVVPVIFSSLKRGLDLMTSKMYEDAAARNYLSAAMDSLLERLITFHSTSPTFRSVFQSNTITQLYTDSYKSFVAVLGLAECIDQDTIRVLEKLSHFGLSVALDNSVPGGQKQEIMDVLKSAEALLNPRASQETAIDSATVVGAKARRRRMASFRMSMQIGESAVKRSIARIHEWRQTVITTERKRLRKTVLDLREHHRQIAALTAWSTILTSERGLWEKANVVRHWRIDETEGPYRVRKKLEPDEEKIPSSKIDSHQHIGQIETPEVESQSILHLELPPWSESYELSSTDANDELKEEIVDDKHRRVRHELEPGDVIDAVKTVARIAGVDSSPGLLIIGRTHLYMLDGLVENDDGEVIEARDAQQSLFFVPGSIPELDSHQRAQRWQHDQIMSFSYRTFLFRDVALEVYFRDSRSLLVVFLDKKQRLEMTNRLSAVTNRAAPEVATPGPTKSPFMGKLSGKFSSALSARGLSSAGQDDLERACRRWQSREISNLTYLSILNQISGRTPSDATQYPVFPWVLSDYTSSTLDLTSSETFRDLTLPMGALNTLRQEAARSRYEALQSIGEDPFHYGTHFSSSMIVCHFLIRTEPFTHMFKILQGGDWDLPDRLFVDILRAFNSASQDIRGDVRELIPEFFTCPEFLENSANLDFGVMQNTGEKIHDVKLPPWAKQDPLLFITQHRKALESDYVSENLPHWIDLIWGYKQRDPEAYNCYHPLSYEGAIDLDSITDDLEREATIGIIHNFGQTPRKIFGAPHPPRNMHGNSALPLGTIYGVAEDYHLLTQSQRPAKELPNGQRVGDLTLDLVGQTVVPCPDGTICVPSRPHECIIWDAGPAAAGVLKVIVDRKPVQVIEAAHCSCAAFADGETLVTGSTDSIVRLWHVVRQERHRMQPMQLELTHLLRAHTAQVLCVAASRAWSLVVSGSKDGSAALWDLNRGVYVRSIRHDAGANAEIHLAVINESNGYIATCSRDQLWLHTVNARPIVSLDLTPTAIAYPPLTALAFLERDYCRTDLIATGAPDGTITLRTWNTDATPEGERARWEFVTLKTLKVKADSRESVPCVTALKFVSESLFHGEDTGKMFVWQLPD